MGEWDPTDRRYEKSIEDEFEYMINHGTCRCYDRLFKGSVEDIKLNRDGTADVSVYGVDEKDEKGHWHFVIKYDERGRITKIYNAHRK